MSNKAHLMASRLALVVVLRSRKTLSLRLYLKYGHELAEMMQNLGYPQLLPFKSAPWKTDPNLCSAAMRTPDRECKLAYELNTTIMIGVLVAVDGEKQ